MAFNTIIFDKNIWEWWFAGQPTGQRILKTVEQWCKEEHADLCFNLAEFNMSGVNKDLSCCEVIAKGRRVSYGYANFTELLYINDQNACRGYSTGIKDNVIKLNRPKSGNRTRNGIGITATGNLIFSQCGHKTTDTALCNDVKNYAKNKGQTVKMFILEDGGGSTSGYSNFSKLKFAPEGGRPVATVLCLRRKSLFACTHPVYKGCAKDLTTENVQIALGGISVDRDAGTATKGRIISAQTALGMPKEMCNGTADYSTLKALGFTIAF